MVHVIEIAFLVAVLALLFYCYKLRSEADEKLNTVMQLQSQLGQIQSGNDSLQREVVNCRNAIHAHSAFLANVGQELRSPLSGVIGMNELLLHTELTKEQRELTKAAMESAQALLNIIADLQELAQLEAGKLPPEVVPTSLPEIIRDACTSCAESARRKHLFINLDVDPAIPSVVLVNRAALKRCLSKLLVNAVTTTQKGGIVLRATCEKSAPTVATIHFSVKDTGIGLTEDEQQRLFQPFGGEEAWTPSYAGTGLGLYLAKRIVDTMGGALSVDSKKGIGSEFRFSLMLEERRQVPDDQATSGNRPYTPPPSKDH